MLIIYGNVTINTIRLQLLQLNVMLFIMIKLSDYGIDLYSLSNSNCFKHIDPHIMRKSIEYIGFNYIFHKHLYFSN